MRVIPPLAPPSFLYARLRVHPIALALTPTRGNSPRNKVWPQFDGRAARRAAPAAPVPRAGAPAARPAPRGGGMSDGGRAGLHRHFALLRRPRRHPRSHRAGAPRLPAAGGQVLRQQRPVMVEALHRLARLLVGGSDARFAPLVCSGWCFLGTGKSMKDAPYHPI